MTQSYAVLLGKSKNSKDKISMGIGFFSDMMGQILPATTIITKKGDCVSITVNHHAFKECLDLRKYSLVFVLFFPKEILH